jgi:hypothetical protein
MEHRVLRLALGAGLLVVAAAPLTPPASAFQCIPLTRVVCTTYSLVCQYVPSGHTVDPHELVCEFS